MEPTVWFPTVAEGGVSWGSEMRREGMRTFVVAGSVAVKVLEGDVRDFD
jgi:hypothetical protein